jgi:hypothetical protein
VFVSVSPFYLRLVFAGVARQEPARVKPIRKYALGANIRLGWKWLNVTNTIAYFNAELITFVKRFIVTGNLGPM